MTLLCIRCGRRERAPGLFVCSDCLERLVAPKEPEWIRRARESRLPAKEYGRAA